MTIRGRLPGAVLMAMLLPGAPVSASGPPDDPTSLDAQVELGDGRTMHLACVGPALTPHPVVIFESDLDGTAGDWAGVMAALPDDVRACAYDRAGVGASAAGPSPRTADALTGDLHALLTAAGLPAPYVFVSEGVGTWITGTYAGRHPDDVAGVVLVDPVSPNRDGALREVLGDRQEGEDNDITLLRLRLSSFLTPPFRTPGEVDLLDLTSRALLTDLGDRPLVILEPANPQETLSPGGRPIDGLDLAGAWEKVRDWLLTRSTTVIHRFVPGPEGISARVPNAVTDAIADVHTKLGIDRGPGHPVARLRTTLDLGARRPDTLIVHDRTGLLAGVRPATPTEASRVDRGPVDDSFAHARPRWFLVGWDGPAPGCPPGAIITVDRDPLHVVVDVDVDGPQCPKGHQRRAVVLTFRDLLPEDHAAPSRYDGLRHWDSTADVSRLTVDVVNGDVDQQVEVEDATGALVSARALRDGEGPRGWQSNVDLGIEVARDGRDLFIRWSDLACTSWSRVRYEEADAPTISVEYGAVPDCDAASVPRGVVLTFAKAPPVEVAIAGIERAIPPTDQQLLTREEAEGIAVSTSLADFTAHGARLAQGSQLDPRLDPPDRWVWAIGLRNPRGNDRCPRGTPFDAPPCPNLSSATVYLDAVTGEVLGTVPGGL